VIKLAAAFVGGAIVGGWLVKLYVVTSAKDAAGGAIDSILGKGSAYGGVAKTFANMFIDSRAN
jgi:hypothetical protein